MVFKNLQYLCGIHILYPSSDINSGNPAIYINTSRNNIMEIYEYRYSPTYLGRVLVAVLGYRGYHRENKSNTPLSYPLLYIRHYLPTLRQQNMLDRFRAKNFYYKFAM